MEERREEGLVQGYRIGKSAASVSRRFTRVSREFLNLKIFENILYKSLIFVHLYIGEGQDPGIHNGEATVPGLTMGACRPNFPGNLGLSTG